MVARALLERFQSLSLPLARAQQVCHPFFELIDEALLALQVLLQFLVLLLQFAELLAHFGGVITQGRPQAGE